jgi:hypothetical protein
LASIERYRRTLLFDQMGYTPAEVRALGGGASQFTLSAGLPKTSEGQFDAGLFAGDDWRLKPNFLLSYGLRYETQTNTHDHGDWAPRLSFAWQPKALKKTVIRGGYGIFYDRFPLADVLLAQRYNGLVQQQYVVNNPTFYPLIPPASTVAALSQGQIIEKLSLTLRAPYVMQGALVLERQPTSNTTAAASYINSHGMHLLRTDIFNAPLPGTYNSTEPGSGIYPLGNPNPIFQMSSDGIYNQNQLIVNVNARLNSQVNLFGYYVYNHAMSNTDGLTTSPANPYSSAGEYSNAVTDIRHRLLIGGSINTRWNLRLSPFITVQSGAPFDITVGHDLYGTTLFNGRPGIATDQMRAGVIETSYGLLDPNPIPEEKLLPRNYGWGPAIVAVNVRLAKTFGFGSRSAAAARGSSPPASPGAASKIPAGKELRSLLSPPPGSSRYNLTVGVSARNVLNHFNPGPIIGDISSPLFGRSNLIYGTPNGEGFLETASNRRLELQIQFKF